MQGVEPPSNYSRFTPIVSASAMPATPGQIYWLWRQGHRIIVSLDPDMPGEVLQAIRDLGFHHIVIPVAELSPPTISQMLRFISIVREAERRNTKILVHCYAGCGRTGTMLAALLIASGYTPLKAAEETRRRRPCSIETQSQMQALKNLWAKISASPKHPNPQTS